MINAPLGEQFSKNNDLIFSKPEKFRVEQEWRIAWQSKDADTPLFINVGPLKDICVIVHKKS